MGEKGEGRGGEGGGKWGKGGGNWEWGTPCPPPRFYIFAFLVKRHLFVFTCMLMIWLK